MPSAGGTDIPLALRMRPRTLAEFIGQTEVVGPGTVLRRAIEEDTLTSVVFWGPPGCGKTTLAEIIANTTNAHFVKVSAVTSSVAEVRRIIAEADERKKANGTKTIMLLDEVHRFNKAQQDALLPAVEEGVIVLIGTTTENPYFSVNSALLSRSRVFQFSALSEDELQQVVTQAIADPERGLGDQKIDLDDDALKHIVKAAGGDARTALNALELAVLTTPAEKDGVIHITADIARDATQKRVILYDRAGEGHYDTISAFIKSMRGSDPDAAVYYLAQMIYAGEDPRFIARRIVIFASEDIGNADPNALSVAVAAAQAVEFVGLPEVQLNLSQAAIYMAIAPKSNAAKNAIMSALKDVREGPLAAPPKHLRNAPHPGMRRHGYGQGYKYPHNYPGHYVEEEYLPPELKGKRYYEPSTSGREKDIKTWLDKLRRQ